MMGFSVGVALAGVLFPPKLGAQDYGKLDDLRVTGSGFGQMIPQLWGSHRVGGNIIWSTDLIESSKRKRSGGKGGGRSSSGREYNYSVSCAVAWCKGPVDRVKRIWAEDLLIYDEDATPDTEYVIRHYEGDEVQVADTLISSIEGATFTPGYRGLCYSVFEGLPLKNWGNRIPAFSAEVVQSESATVGTVLADIFAQCGLTSQQYVITDANAIPIYGFIIANRQEAQQALEHLLLVYGVDLCDIDGKIVAKAQGSNPVVTIRAEDLGALYYQQGENRSRVRVGVKLLQDLELPGAIDLNYLTQPDYQKGTQPGIRVDKQHIQNRETVTTAIVLPDSEARQRAQRLIDRRYIEQGTFDFSLMPSYIRLAPGDVVNLPIGTPTTARGFQLLRVKLTRVDMPLPIGPLKCEAVLDDAATITQNVAGQTPRAISEVVPVGVTNLRAFSINSLLDADGETVGFYYGVAGATAGDWPGAALYMSRDNGNSYQEVDTITDPMDYGTAATVLAAPTLVGTGAIDRVNTVDVTMTVGVPTSISEIAMLQGENMALLGDEVIGFATVTPLGGSSYRLSNLLRGRRGTDFAWSSHAMSERFVLLDIGKVHRVTLDTSFVNKDVLLKPVTIGDTLAATSPVSLTITGAELKPYTVCDVKGARDGSDNLTITWKRRTRHSGELTDFIDAPLNETTESYAVEIWDAGYTTLKRTINVVAQTAPYSAADQTTDFGSPQASVAIKIFQNSAFLGRGYEKRATV
jgi:hypothetical protein